MNKLILAEVEKWYHSLSKERQEELDKDCPVGLDSDDPKVFYDWLIEDNEVAIRTFINVS